MTMDIHEAVRQRYAAAADLAQAGGCCGSEPGIGAALYDIDERAALPDAAVLASLGCGNPTALAELRPGERVLDLGSGGGIDVLLSARRVGPEGRAFGLDMTDEMLTLARRNATEAGATNVEFLRGEIESIPLPAGSIDVVISNCVVNLAADKAAVFREIARVLVPGGRIGIADIVADDGLTPAERAERGSYVGCIAGALTTGEYEEGLRSAGLTEIAIARTHEVVQGMSSAIIRAVKPMAATLGGGAGESGASLAGAVSFAASDLARPALDMAGGCCGGTGCC